MFRVCVQNSVHQRLCLLRKQKKKKKTVFESCVSGAFDTTKKICITRTTSLMCFGKLNEIMKEREKKNV